MTVQPAAASASCRLGVGVGVGEDRGDAAQRADPVHGDRAELARVGQHVGGAGVRDDRAPGGHLGRVVVGQPGLRVHAARARGTPCRRRTRRRRPRPARRSRPRRRAGPARRTAAARPRSRSTSSIAAGTELVSTRPRKASGQRPGHLQRGGADVDDDRVLGLDQGRGERGDRPLARRVQGAAGGEVALAWTGPESAPP